MMKRKTDELGFIKSQNCSSKGAVVRMKRQESLGKKNICKARGIKDLYSQYIKESLNSVTGTT